MAKRINKSVVALLTGLGIVVIAGGGFIWVKNLPGHDPARYAEKAAEWEAQGDNYRAAKMFFRAWNKDPGRNPQYLVDAARCSLADGAVGDARELINRARISDAGLLSAAVLSVDLHLEMARLLDSASAWSDLLEEAKKLVEVDADSAYGHRALGLSYLRLSGTEPRYKEEAETAFKTARKLDPLDTESARALIEYLWMEARALEQAGRAQAAEELKREAEDVLRSSVDTIVRSDDAKKIGEIRRFEALMEVRRAGGDGTAGLPAAIQRLQALRAEHPNDGSMYLELGRFLGFPGPTQDLDQAEAALKKAVEVEPTLAEGYLFLGRFLRARGKTDEEMETYRRGLAAIPFQRRFQALIDNRYRIEMLMKLGLEDVRRASTAAQDGKAQEEAEAFAAAAERIEDIRKEGGADSAAARLLSAYVANARGDYKTAIKEAEDADRVLGGGRRFFELEALKAELYFREKQWGLARQAAESVIQMEPGALPFFLMLGQIYLVLDQPAETVRVLTPQSPEGLRAALDGNKDAVKLRMEAYRKLEQFALAEAENKRLEKLGEGAGGVRSAALLMLQEKYAEAEQILRGLLAAEPVDEQTVRAMVQLLDATDRRKEADDLLASMSERYPDNRDYRRWRLGRGEGDPDEKEVLAFLNDEPDEFMRALSLFGYYVSKEDIHVAVKQLDAAERIQPNRPEVLERQFRASIVLRDWKRAESFARRIADLNLDATGGKQIFGRLALAQAEVAESENKPEHAELYNRAIESLRAALNTYPTDAAGWAYLAEAYAGAKRTSDMRSALQRSLALDPTNGYANKIMADIAIREGDEEGRRRYLKQAARAFPDDPWVNQELSRLNEEEKPDTAIVEREKIRQKSPNDVVNLMRLARLYHKTRHYDKAAECYRQSMDAAKKDPDVDEMQIGREMAGFFGLPEVNLPAEGEAILEQLLRDRESEADKATVATYLGRFHESRNTWATADRYYQMAVRFHESLDTLLAAAEFYTRTNQYGRALECYGKAIQKAAADPARDQLLRSRSISLRLTMRDLENAEREIQEYLERFPDDLQGLVLLGTYHLIGEDIEQAQQAFSRVLEKDPSNGVALWQRGQLHLLRERWLPAIEDLRKAKAFDPDGFEYQHRIALAEALLESGRGDEGAAELRSILDEHPTETRVGTALVDLYMRMSPPRPVDAENLIVTFMRQNPGDVAWPAVLGQLASQLKDWSKAVLAYEQAAEMSQFRSEIVQFLFRALKEAGRPADIIRYATEKLSLRRLENSPGALTSLGWAYAQAGREEEALEAYELALRSVQASFGSHRGVVMEMANTFGKDRVLQRAIQQANSDPEDIGRQKSLLHLLYLTQQYEEAVKVAERIVELAVIDADSIFGRMGLADLLTRVGRHADARAQYEAVLKIDPDQVVALNNLAYLLTSELNAPEEALPYARRAVRLNPANADILDTLGWALKKAGRKGEALTMLLRAVNAERTNVTMLYHLGALYKDRGEREAAVDKLQEAWKLGREREKQAAAAGDDRLGAENLPMKEIRKALEELGERVE